MDRIDVTKTFLPPIEEYTKYLKQIWDTGQLTNQGPLLLEFETRIKEQLGVDHAHFLTNGTLSLQIALSSLGIKEGEIITTPFSYVATTSAILWERCSPVFVDINSANFNIDADKIEAAITPNTKAILAVHVFGFPCDIKKINEIARRHKLKVIYDAAHAFGVEYEGKQILSYGDVSICSFHATKLFHTIEGGLLVTPDAEVSDRTELIKRFGHDGDNHYLLGINAKASEFQAAMGLCNLEYIKEIIESRKKAWELYSHLLSGNVEKPSPAKEIKYNYSYYPIVFTNKETLISTLKKLNEINIFPRRYFYPSLNTLPYIYTKQSCPTSEDISERIMCLPLFSDISTETIEKICQVINQ